LYSCRSCAASATSSYFFLLVSSAPSIYEKVELNSSTVNVDEINTQMGRAIARWEDAYNKEYFNEKVYKNVLDRLNDKEVPPIYHTLCRDPAKRLFLPNSCVSGGKQASGNIEISSKTVKAGKGSSDSHTRRKIWDKTDFSYCDAFFTKIGKARINVRDSFLEKDWKFDEEITNAVVELVNSPSKMVGHDLEVTELPLAFPIDRKNGRNLITRSLSRGVVADCYEHSKPGSVHAIVGSPGIGKSWSLIYALQQALLFENVCVLYCFQKKGIAWLCIRKKDKIHAWIMESDNFKVDFDCGLFKNGNVLALLDTKEAPAGGNFYTCKRQRLIFAATNKAAHFKNALKKNLDYERILNQYSASELKIALKYMSPTKSLYSEEEVLPMLAYAEQIGNMPCYVQSEQGYNLFSEKVQRYVQEYVEKMDSTSLLDFLRFKGTVSAEVKDSAKDAIFSLFAVGSMNDHYDLVDVGYDGDAAIDGKAVVQYDKRGVMFASNYAKMQIGIAQRAALLSYDVKTADGLGGYYADIVEELCWIDLKNRTKVMVHRLRYHEDDVQGTAELCDIEDVSNDDGYDSDSNDDVYDSDGLDSEGNDGEKYCFEFTSALDKRVNINEIGAILNGTSGKSCICRMSVNCLLMDFFTSDGQCLQVTVKKDHIIKGPELQEFFVSVGIAKIIKSGNDQESETFIENPNVFIGRKFEFYWVVPEGIAKSWKKKSAVRASKLCKNSMVLNDLLEKYVDQYVAIMSPN
jgi:hypothetical protein